MSDTPTERGWKAIFASLPLADRLRSDGIAFISADQIRNISGREPRLMTKFDSRSERPPILKTQNNVTILPVENGRYALIRGDGYYDVQPAQSPEIYSSSRLQSIETLPWRESASSEGQVLDISHVASMLRDFTEEESLYLTIRGRLRSGSFEFAFQGNNRTHQLQASGVQIEVDGGYEGNRLYIIEAKIGVRDDFIVRQLYYPYRMWTERGINKEIVPILLTYSNKVFSLRQYRFTDLYSYNSIVIVKARDYSLDLPEEPPSLAELLARTTMQGMPQGPPFPQADDMRKVFDMVDAISAGIQDKYELADLFDYDPRQSDYYGNAARFLGLANRGRRSFLPNESSFEFVKLNRSERTANLAARLVSLPVVRQGIEAALSGKPLTREEIIDLIQRNSILGGGTADRRAITVEKWIDWLLMATRD